MRSVGIEHNAVGPSRRRCSAAWSAFGIVLLGPAVLGWTTRPDALIHAHPATVVIISVMGVAGIGAGVVGRRAPARSWSRRLSAAFGWLVAVLVVALMVFLMPLAPTADARSALDVTATSDVAVEQTSSTITMRPVRVTAQTGLVFYPGMPVDARAYAALLRPVAADGRVVIIVKNPLQVALLSGYALDNAVAAHPDVDRWAVGGHSLGGMQAAIASRAAVPALRAVVLWAPACPIDGTVPERLPVTILTGGRDGVIPLGDIRACGPRWTPTTRIIEISGANHAQFGDYGEQIGDLPATADTVTVQSQLLQATRTALEASLGSPINGR